ncbi:MAG: polyprenyl synthetase family protein [Eubacteriales bacterium]|nr:polyprenyl synthetase family protein [Eubacteriales bacterium]
MNSQLLEQQQAYIKAVNTALEIYMKRPGIPDRLRESMAYSLFAGGKRLRPVLLLACNQMLSGDMESAMPFACAIEMIHSYSLIHDDLPAMDNDDLRRGKPTNHKVFGEGMAVLAGDGLLSYAVQIMAEACAAGTRAQMLAMQAVLQGAGVTGMVAGQCLDLENERNPVQNEATLRAIHAGKTGAMLIAAVTAGAHTANANASQVTALARFGEQYGLLFQITDDILDVTGTAAQMGKTLGKDAASGKLTYPSLFGLNESKRKAVETAELAKASLEIFGQSAAFLHELVSDTLKRDY